MTSSPTQFNPTLLPCSHCDEVPAASGRSSRDFDSVDWGAFFPHVMQENSLVRVDDGKTLERLFHGFTGNVRPSCDPRARRPFTTGIIGGPMRVVNAEVVRQTLACSRQEDYWIVDDHSTVISRPIAVFQAHSVPPDSVDFGFLPCRYAMLLLPTPRKSRFAAPFMHSTDLCQSPTH